MPADSTDRHYLLQCFSLAELGRLTCSPNPVVGCIIVKEGQTVGEGWHQYAGADHAEIVALKQAGELAFGATAYISLEPCSHHGRTPPCSVALIKSGITRVVYAMQDPDPRVSGKGASQLEAAGIQVLGPLLQEEAEKLNPGYLKRVREGLPFVRLKLAMSLDGRTAMASGESKWITSEASRMDVQLWRARSDAILTGIGTILKDDAALNVRLEDYPGSQPLRVVIDSKGRIPASAKVLQIPGSVLVATAKGRPLDLNCNSDTEVELRTFAGTSGQVDLRAVLEFLAETRLVNEVLVEAGSTLGGALLQAGLVDELLVYVAPKLLGDQALPMLQLAGLDRLLDCFALSFVEISMVGGDCRIRAVPEIT